MWKRVGKSRYKRRNRKVLKCRLKTERVVEI